MIATRAADGRPPLDGLRVLSLAEQFPGPFAMLLLSDLGADVVQVERPGGGDPSRRFPGFYSSLNRNKRSIAVDLKTRDGRKVLHRLAAGADVLLEGFRPGTAARLGVGYRALSRVNSRLVMVSVSGFGQSGPYRPRPAHDLSYQALAGMLAPEDGVVRVPPLAIADLSSGLFGALAVMVGLWQRQQTGRGCHVDVAMLDGLVTLMASRLVPVLNGYSEGVPPEPGYGIYRTEDGALVSLSVAHEDHFWRNLCGCVGLESYAELDGPERVRRADLLRALLAEQIGRRPLSEWSQLFEGADVPFAPVLKLAEVPEDVQVRARELVVALAGGERHVRQPLVVDGRAPRPTRPAPRLGEHSLEILAEAGYGSDEVEALLSKGVVADGARHHAGAGAAG